MKRTIQLFILTTVLFLAGASTSYAFNDTTSISIIGANGTSSAPKIFSSVLLKVVIDDGSLDLSTSDIIWFINKDKIIDQGIGHDTVTIKTESSDFTVRVRVVPKDVLLGESPYLETTSDISPTIISGGGSKSSKFVTQSEQKSKGSKMYLISKPSKPRKFERVEYSIVNTTDEPLQNEEIIWSVNGVERQTEIGKTIFIIRMTSPEGASSIMAKIPSKGWEDTISFIPANDPSLRLNDTQASRVLRCTAQSVRLIARDMDVMKRRADMFAQKYNELKPKIGKDITVLETTITKLPADIVIAAKDMFKLATTFTVSRFGSLMIIELADNISKMAEYILTSDISARIKYISNEIEYYNRLIKWLDDTQYNIQRDADMMVKRLDSQKKRCIDLANEEIQPLDEQDVGSTKDFRQYEW